MARGVIIRQWGRLVAARQVEGGVASAVDVPPLHRGVVAIVVVPHPSSSSDGTLMSMSLMGERFLSIPPPPASRASTATATCIDIIPGIIWR